MEYKYLIEQNREYQKLSEKYNEILNKKRDDLEEINNQILKNLDLDKFSHHELKELMDLVGYNVNKEVKERLNNIYLSKKPYTHKVVEKMTFLSNNQKIQLDLNLSYFKNRYIISAFWSKIGVLDKDIQEKIIGILLEEKLIRRDYKLCCSKCFSYIKLLKEDDLNEIKEFDDLKAKIKEYESDKTQDYSKELDVLYDKYYDIEEGDSLLCQYCSECDNEVEFDDLNQLLKSCIGVYFLL